MKSSVLRALAAMVVALLTFGVLATAAAAEAPIQEDVAPIEPFVFTACGFPILVEGIQEKGKTLDFGDHVISTGVVKWRLTNPATGTSIDVNVSGPARMTLSEDGDGFVIKYEGRTLFLIGPRLGARVGLEPGLYVSTGLVDVEGTLVNGLLFITSITQIGGTWTSLCPQLAG